MEKTSNTAAPWQVRRATVNTHGELSLGQACMIQCINPLILAPPRQGKYNIIHFSSTHRDIEAQDAQPVAKVTESVSGNPQIQVQGVCLQGLCPSPGAVMLTHQPAGAWLRILKCVYALALKKLVIEHKEL